MTTPHEPAPEDHTFTDAKGRRHVVELTASRARKIKATWGIDLVNVSPKTLELLSEDRERAWDILWLLCESSATEAYGIDKDEFEDALDGQANAEASAAIFAAIRDFSPPETRAALQALWEAAEETQAAATAQLVESIRSGPVRDKIKAKVAEQLEAALSADGPSSTSSQLSPAPRRRTPTPSAAST